VAKKAGTTRQNYVLTIAKDTILNYTVTV